jgi:23S rRNA (cytosine1962-C5)-methyltransferase
MTTTTTPPRTYSLMDFGDGRRLEQWGPYRLVRPDPTARGGPAKAALWRGADAVYEGQKGRGRWVTPRPLPPHWAVEFDDLRLAVRLAPYKHTGVFPEQRQNWRWVRERAGAAGRALNVLNLFAYTGGATVALAKDGHFVTHVDAAKPSIGWAKENAALNELPGDRVRWILDDAPAFAAREIRRGRRYDGIILDPPAFGHSPSGKTFRAERDLAPLLEKCCELLSERPAFLVLNGYAQQDTPGSFHRLLSGVLHARTGLRGFRIEAAELELEAADGRRLSTGVVGRCAFG